MGQVFNSLDLKSFSFIAVSAIPLAVASLPKGTAAGESLLLGRELNQWYH